MTNPRRERFARIFPARVDMLRDTLRKISNCSNRTNYEWNNDLVQNAWILIAEEFTDTAAQYGVDFRVEVSMLDSKG